MLARNVPTTKNSKCFTADNCSNRRKFFTRISKTFFVHIWAHEVWPFTLFSSIFPTLHLITPISRTSPPPPPVSPQTSHQSASSLRRAPSLLRGKTPS